MLIMDVLFLLIGYPELEEMCDSETGAYNTSQDGTGPRDDRDERMIGHTAHNGQHITWRKLSRWCGKKLWGKEYHMFLHCK